MQPGNTIAASDEALIDALEGRSLPPGEFTHREHLRAAWAYLGRYGFPDGAVRFQRALKGFVAHVGATAKYHETITWAYLLVLNEERVLRSPPGESFDSLLARRPDLLDHRRGVIARYYSKDELASEAARRVFVLPSPRDSGDRAA